MDKEEMINDKLTKICLCKGVTKFTIKECIESGMNTLEDIKKNTGAATGACRGRRCLSKINELIDEYAKREN